MRASLYTTLLLWLLPSLSTTAAQVTTSVGSSVLSVSRNDIDVSSSTSEANGHDSLVDTPHVSDTKIRNLIDRKDQVVAEILDRNSQEEEEERALQSSNNMNSDGSTGRSHLQRCGRRNACEPGLECRAFGMTGRRCMASAECLSEKMKEINGGHANTSVVHMEDVYRDARITEGDLVLALGDNDGLDPVARANAFLASSPFQTFLASFRKNYHLNPADQESLAECMGGINSTQQQPGGELSYSGFHIEFGAFADFSITFGFPINDSDQETFLRLCLGAGLGVGIEVSRVLGSFVGAWQKRCDLFFPSIQFDTDFVLGSPALGAAGGLLLNGNVYGEYTTLPCLDGSSNLISSVGLGVEPAGVSFCPQFPCPGC